ncbi:nacht and ankyrin domain protein [Colletotrichum karsti]|uniref:Nacht and ankyrin domain protein n=1 Tax=Colletotrichum karsti TaxID=1095194 RepID=A0A9P6HY31_9PEZI|nr:nacht and ankyrin domain protein [Colletotrichum karsti]KAF9872958.1 nacht and ankyrin domain protein [Colletotrichum karsti]
MMEPNAEIVAVFGPPPEGSDVAESSVTQNNAAVIVLAVLASAAVALRLWARLLQGHSMKADDWTIIVSLLLVGATVGLSIVGGVRGAGNHIWSCTLPDLTNIFQVLYAYTFVYGTACAATKISILLFYQRVFVSRIPSFRVPLIIGYFLSISYPIVIWVTMGNACKPLHFYWNQFVGATGTCIDINTFYLALGIINMLNDIIVLLIPIPQILKLQMSGRKKLAVCSIMLLGSFVCVASIIRIWYLDKFSKAVDITWMMGPVFIWSAIEPSVAIVSACLPHLAPLRRLVGNKISSTQRSNGQSGPSSASTPWRSGKSGTGGGSQKGAGALFTYGGSRFPFGNNGDGMVKLDEEGDEIGLTNRVATKGSVGKSMSAASGSDENINSRWGLSLIKRKIEDDEETTQSKRHHLEVKPGLDQLQNERGLNSFVKSTAWGIRADAAYQHGSTYNGAVTAQAGSSLHLGNNITIYNGDVQTRTTTADEGGGQDKIKRILKDWSQRLQFNYVQRRRDQLEATVVASGTCQWLFKTEEFTSWETEAVTDGHVPVLVLKGKAGSGKSVLLNAALRRSESLSCDPSQDQITLGFFFNARDSLPLEHSRQGLYRSLLSQLLHKTPPAGDICELLETLQPVDDEWDVFTLQRTICKVLRLIQGQRVFLFIDALDECLNDDEDEDSISHMLDVLEFIKSLSETGADVRIIDVMQYNQPDIERYLKEELDKIVISPETRKKLLSAISDRASNMFLWVRLVISRIKQRTLRESYENDTEMLDEVKNTPKKLKDLYKTLLENVDLDKRQDALTLLQLIQAAVRPLTLDEVRSAIGKSTGSSGDVQELSDAMRDLKMAEEGYRLHILSGGLVEVSYVSPGLPRVDETSPVVQFIHKSVRDFLEKGELKALDRKLTTEPEAHFHLCAAKLCMAVIDRSKDSGHEPSFLPYASQYWMLHARRGDKVTDNEIELPDIFAFCSNRTEVIFELLNKYKSARFHTNVDDIPNPRAITCKLNRGNCDASPDPEACRESLLVLLAHEGCAKLLAQHARECQRSSRCWGHPHILDRAFFFAVHRGYVDAARAVWDLSREVGVTIEVDKVRLKRLTPLFAACFKGKREVAEFLLEIGADAMAEARMSPWLPLHAAVAQGYTDVVQLLLRHPGHDAKEMLAQKNSSGMTVLHHAAKAGHVALLVTLLKELRRHRLGHLVREDSNEGTALDIAEAMVQKLKATPGASSASRLEGFLQVQNKLDEFASAIE